MKLLVRKHELTVQLLKRTLRYEPATGKFVNLIKRGNLKVGDEAGTTSKSSDYHRVSLFNTVYNEHHLVWFYCKGRWPTEELDHKNRNRSDNRISNLRECTHLEQQQNQKIHKTNKSGFPNVCWDKYHKKWRVKLLLDKKQKHIGYFAEFEKACEEAIRAKASYHSFHPTHNV